jgi:hypothetical protein
MKKYCDRCCELRYCEKYKNGKLTRKGHFCNFCSEKIADEKENNEV